MKVPFNDLTVLHEPMRDQLSVAINTVIEKNSFIKGAEVSHFEEQFAEYCGVEHCVGVGNGTDALVVALNALGIGLGDEVITSAFGFVATSEAISLTGAKPVFVDCEENSPTIDPDCIEAAITDKTRAILVVHLHGLPAELDAIEKIAKRRKLHIIEDCAQSHGAEYNGMRIGASGNLCTFSFYPGKNLGAFGDAGCIVCQDQAMAEHMRMYANHGRSKKFDHAFEGINSRLDSIQAAVLSIKLSYLDMWNRERREIATRYNDRLSKLGLVTSRDHQGRLNVYHIMAVLVDDRAEVQKALKHAGVSTGIHYPIPIHKLAAYIDHSDSNRHFPHADKWATKELSLPMFPGMSDSQIEYVCDTLSEIISENPSTRAVS